MDRDMKNRILIGLLVLTLSLVGYAVIRMRTDQFIGQTDQLFAAIESDDSASLIAALDKDKRVVKCKLASGNTLLHNAAFLDSKKCLNILLEYGADINAKNNDRKTPLYYALFRKNLDYDTVKVLILHGATIDNTDRRSVDLVNKQMRARKEFMLLLKQIVE